MTRWQRFMTTPNANTNDAQPSDSLGLLGFLPGLDSAEGFGSAMLGLAQAAAALHRAQAGGVQSQEGLAGEGWGALETIELDSMMDEAGHGCPPVPRNARGRGPEATEGDR